MERNNRGCLSAAIAAIDLRTLATEIFAIIKIEQFSQSPARTVYLARNVKTLLPNEQLSEQLVS